MYIRGQNEIHLRDRTGQRCHAEGEEMNRFSWSVTLAVLVSLSFAGCRSSLQSDKQAVDAVEALRRLDSKIEVGMTFPDYSATLGEVNFAVRDFLDSDQSKKAPVFSEALKNA